MTNRDYNSTPRNAIPDGVWICNAAPRSPGTTVDGSSSGAAFVSKLYAP